MVNMVKLTKILHSLEDHRIGLLELVKTPWFQPQIFPLTNPLYHYLYVHQNAFDIIWWLNPKIPNKKGCHGICLTKTLGNVSIPHEIPCGTATCPAGGCLWSWDAHLAALTGAFCCLIYMIYVYYIYIYTWVFVKALGRTQHTMTQHSLYSRTTNALFSEHALELLWKNFLKHHLSWLSHLSHPHGFWNITT